MPTASTAGEVLERELLAVRAKLLDVAAVLDRIDRAEGSLADDPRLERVREALELLRGEGSDRAERLLALFSLPYQENWQEDYDLDASTG